jgi:hypothetical protein
MEACLEKAKANPEMTKTGLKEVEAAVDVFEERVNKMDTRIWRPIEKCRRS